MSTTTNISVEPPIGIISPNAIEETIGSETEIERIGHLGGSSIRQVEGGAAMKPVQNSSDFSIFDMASTGSHIVEKLLSSAPEKVLQDLTKKLESTSDEKEKEGLRDAVTILEDTISYKLNFIGEEQRISKRSNAVERTDQEYQKSMRDSFAHVIATRLPIVERNIAKLMEGAERVIELHAKRSDLLALMERPDARHIVSDALQEIQNAINDELRYAHCLKEGRIADARKIKADNAYLRSQIVMASKLSQFYEICQEQLIAAGRDNEAENFRAAKEAVNIAGRAFKKATISMPESAKHSYIQGGNYRLQAAKARIEGRNNEAESFSVAAVRAMIAGVNFEKTARTARMKG